MGIDPNSELILSDKKQQKQLNNLIKKVEASYGCVGFLVISQNKWKLFGIHILIGIARGLGFALGGSLILGLIIFALQQVIAMNIPYLTDLLQQMLLMIKNT
ncbi:MAG: hypothetical protein J5838_04050 [Desulfovibrio sp.]|nr:hypothetical protein [Desulfovibrio sp.]